jgi:hypothetical protein
MCAKARASISKWSAPCSRDSPRRSWAATPTRLGITSRSRLGNAARAGSRLPPRRRAATPTVSPCSIPRRPTRPRLPTRPPPRQPERRPRPTPSHLPPRRPRHQRTRHSQRSRMPNTKSSSAGERPNKCGFPLTRLVLPRFRKRLALRFWGIVQLCQRSTRTVMCWLRLKPKRGQRHGYFDTGRWRNGRRRGLKIRSEKSGEGSTPSRPTFRCFSGLFPYHSLVSPDIAKSAVGNCAGLYCWHRAILPCFRPILYLGW